MNDGRIAPVFQILAEDIHAFGIRTVFGLMSDDTAVFAVTLDGLGVKFVGARHEGLRHYEACPEEHRPHKGLVDGTFVLGNRPPPPSAPRHSIRHASRDECEYCSVGQRHSRRRRLHVSRALRRHRRQGIRGISSRNPGLTPGSP